MAYIGAETGLHVWSSLDISTVQNNCNNSGYLETPKTEKYKDKFGYLKKNVFKAR